MLKEINNSRKIRNLLVDQVIKTSTLLINLQQIKCSGREIVKVVISQISTMIIKRRKVCKGTTSVKIHTILMVPQGGGRSVTST
jgi:hypothetical protein